MLTTNRYDNEHRWRSNNSSNNTGRSYNGYNSGRTRSDYNRSNSNNNSYQGGPYEK